MKHGIFRCAALLTLLVGATMWWLWQDMQRFLQQPVHLTDTYIYTIETGMTLRAVSEDLAANGDLITLARDRVGRLVFNGFPTGVEVVDAMQHGGPYPATTDARFTAVGRVGSNRRWSSTKLLPIPI